MTFDPAFRFYSDGRDIGRHPEPACGWPTFFVDLQHELDVEMRRRNDLYPSLIAKGRMSRADVDRELARWSLLAENLRGSAAGFGRTADWPDMIHALRREITMRRKLYPQWIERRQITAAEADRKLLLIEILHDMLWRAMPAELLVDGIGHPLDFLREPRAA